MVASNERLTAAIEAFKTMVEEGRLAHEGTPVEVYLGRDRAEAIHGGLAPWTEPRHLGFYDYARAIPGFAERIRRVPAIAVAEVGDDDDGPFAMVACPCDFHPIVRDSIAKCEGCERYYVLVKTGAVLVFYGNMDVPQFKEA